MILKACIRGKDSCDFVDVTPVEEPVIGTDGILEDGRIQVIAVNDGWGDASEVKASWHLSCMGTVCRSFLT